MKASVHNIDDEHSDEEFAQKVQQDLDSRKRIHGVGTLACEKCQKGFLTQWELNQHMRWCRLAEASRLVLQLNDKYPCSICDKEYDTVREFRRHCFLQHSESDIKKHYNRSLEKLMGKKDLKDIRNPILTTIRKGKFEEFAIKLLDQRSPFNKQMMNQRLPIRQDMGLESSQSRKNFYLQQRDILIKIAETKAPGKRLSKIDEAVIEIGDESITYSWNFIHDYDYENFPVEIANCLQTVLNAKRSNQEIFPHYIGYSKSGNIVSVEVSTLPLQLRKVIGNRGQMERFGATLMKTLIQGYLTIKKSRQVMRGLQPSTIYISEDATKVQFVDILSMTNYNEEPKNRIGSDQPYSVADEWAGANWDFNFPQLDMHSLGVIILEILVGTDVVLSCNGWEAVDDLVKDCEQWID